MREKVLQHIRDKVLLRAGDRVVVAVSGGADSVALLRVLLELRAELGIVLSIAHFNHGLRDASAADEAFVAALAKKHKLEFFAGHGDVRDHASASKLGIEGAGRALRYRWFTALATEQRLNAIATAHTLDDQAETVLLKFLRGAGTRGLAGIYPIVQLQTPGAKAQIFGKDGYGTPEGVPLQNSANSLHVIRPLLCVSRSEVELYLAAVGQTWREDESNLDRRFLRNRVRHELLPLLERDFNPNIRRALSDLAEISRGEEAYWQEETEDQWIPRVLGSDRNEGADASSFAGTSSFRSRLQLNDFARIPLALQRRLLKRFAEQQQIMLDFEHIERLRRCALGELSKVGLPGDRVAFCAGRELSIRPALSKEVPTSYSYRLMVPGRVYIAELGLTVRADAVPADFAAELPVNDLLSSDLVGPELIIRNWLAGDRFNPVHGGSEEKLKRLFLERKIPAEQRPTWPVAVNGDQIVWVRGFPVAKAFRWRRGGAIKIEVSVG